MKSFVTLLFYMANFDHSTLSKNLSLGKQETTL